MSPEPPTASHDLESGGAMPHSTSTSTGDVPPPPVRVPLEKYQQAGAGIVIAGEGRVLE